MYMNNLNFISSTMTSVITVLILLNLVSCKPSLEKESNAIRHTISILDTISHDNILLITNLIKEADPRMQAYQNKVANILVSEETDYTQQEIFSIQKRLVSLYIDKVERYDKHLTGMQRKVFRKSMLGGVKKSFEIALELDTLTTPQFSKLSKEDKTKVLADTKAKIIKEFEGMSAADEYMRKKVYNTIEAILGSNRFLD